MADVLFLAHRIPYPPDKGDKIRSWHLLRHLARRHRVHLGCFIDDPADRVHRQTLREVCGADGFFADLRPWRARLRALPGLLGEEPLTLAYYRDADMARWVKDVLRCHRPAAALAFSAAMAPYLAMPAAASTRRVLDLVDVDSDKWRQCAERGRWPMRAVHAREARTLLTFERRAAAAFDATTLVSANETALFRRLAPECAGRVHTVANGVDAERFDPATVTEASPFPADTLPLVFTGAMDYWPNVDAVGWFAREVLPLVRARHPDAGFFVVGSNPTPTVLALASLPGVHVTGRVADMRPWLAHAAVVVAPLRIARGVQNKVLEAMAMARPVVATPQAAQGLEPEDRTVLRLAEEPAAFAEAVAGLLGGDGGLGRRARQRVLDAHAWDGALARLDRLLGLDDPAHASAAAG